MTKLNSRQELTSDAVIFIATLVIALIIHSSLGTRLSAGGLLGVVIGSLSFLIIYKVSRVEGLAPRYILIGTLSNLIAQLLLKYLAGLGE